MPKIVKILALPNTYGASLLGVLDMLEAANTAATNLWQVDEKPFDIEVVTLSGEPVQCSNGLSISGNGKVSLPHAAQLGEPYQPEILMVAAPYVPTIGDLSGVEKTWQEEIAWLRKNHHYYGQICSHCNGTFVLAEAGILDGHEVTTSWWLARSFKQRYPQLNLQVDKRVLQSGRFLLGGSSSCFRDLIVHFVQQHCGAEVARVLMRYFLVDNSQSSQMLYAKDASLSSDNPVIHRAQQWILGNLDKNLSVVEVAEKAAVTTRTLVRHFQKDFGHSPQTHIQKLRIEKSKALLETTKLKLQEIAQRCGYSDEGAFRRLFKKHCEVSPTEFRRMFQLTT